MGVAFGSFASRLSFFDGPAVAVERRGVTASFDYRLSETSTIGGGAGAGLGGLFAIAGERHVVLPGWMLLGTWSRRLVDGSGSKPFVLLGVAFGVSGARTREEVRSSRAAVQPAAASLYAIDVRAAITVGKTFFQTISPYASARLFGGPVFWGYRGNTVLGGDTRHYQISLGMTVAMPRGVDMFVDGSPLGEQAITLGAGKSF